MCGIFAYVNHRVPRTRSDILRLLVAGLQRLEYRGYDSAGLAVDGDTPFAGDAALAGTGACRQACMHACAERGRGRAAELQASEGPRVCAGDTGERPGVCVCVLERDRVGRVGRLEGLLNVVAK